MTVLAKFYVCRLATAVFGGQYADPPHHEVDLRPVTSGSKSNEEFFKWTPGGEVKLVLKNGHAEPFKAMGEFYVRFAREFRTADEFEAAKAQRMVPPHSALRFVVDSIGNRASGAEKLFDVKLRGVDDASGSTITIGTINEAAAREFIDFVPMLVWFEAATAPPAASGG